LNRGDSLAPEFSYQTQADALILYQPGILRLMSDFMLRTLMENMDIARTRTMLRQTDDNGQSDRKESIEH